MTNLYRQLEPVAKPSLPLENTLYNSAGSIGNRVLKLVLAVVATLLSLIVGCNSVVRTVTSERQPLTYVGDITFGEPIVSPQEIEIPIQFENGEWHQNSAIVPRRIVSKVDGRDIDIIVETAVATESAGSDGAKLTIPGNAVGKYHIYYRDPDGVRTKLDDIEIPSR